jgi:glycerol-3-phosphate cytidylyltransferase
MIDMKRVLTYGTYDLLHWGHINILKRAKQRGDYLIVALSTDEFNKIKGKKSYHSYNTRRMMLEAVRYVDLVVPESSWGQKRKDVEMYGIDEVVMGSDWSGNGRFEVLRDVCRVTYLPRTEGVSTSKIKSDLGVDA